MAFADLRVWITYPGGPGSALCLTDEEGGRKQSRVTSQVERKRCKHQSGVNQLRERLRAIHPYPILPVGMVDLSHCKRDLASILHLC